ncbi:unnamed protein product [Pieris macdunnoughi]|uniref:Exonuclease domain-containing protein n=2 Tax=Pieris macdunnoughi TaxID=345717 RepID=A0A821VJI8_9NEOP|nr:unnamed protein product [Pieris macdunnoughi]
MMNLSYEPCKKKARREVQSKYIKRKNKEEDSVEEKTYAKPPKKHTPKFRLKSAGHIASLATPLNERIPIVLTDIQHLLLHSLLGNLNITQSPRWYTIDKCNHVCQTTCLIIEGISINQLEEHKEKLININTIFENFVEILTPSVYSGSLVKELALVPLSETEKECIIQKYGSLNLALEVRKDLMVMMRAVFPIDEDNEDKIVQIECEDKFPRTQLLLSAWQLIEENYPVPLKGKLKNIYSDYVFSKEEYKAVTADSPMFGLDCEMCITNVGSELTRVSVVDEKYKLVYESLVKPYNNITDYLTRYSGISESSLKNITKRLEDVQKELREVLPPDAILVGQSLNSDLHALKMFHPYVIDTSLIYNFTGERTRKSKLKILAKEFLNMDIQTNKNGHCSIEDSIAALKLVQLKLSKFIEFGDAVHTNRQNYKENVVRMSTKSDYALSIFNHIIEQKKTSLVVGCDDITGDYHTYLTQAKDSMSTQLKKGKPKKVKLSTVDTVDDVITTVTEAANDYNLIMAHLKQNSTLESCHATNIDEWVKNIWSSLKESALFVVIFSGNTAENGVAMIRVKTK